MAITIKSAKPAPNPADMLIVALDLPGIEEVNGLLSKIHPEVRLAKIGQPHIVSDRVGLTNMILATGNFGISVFCDSKLWNTCFEMAKALKNISILGPQIISISAMAGQRAVEECVKEKGVSKIVGVGILTTVPDKECMTYYGGLRRFDINFKLAEMLKKAGADGMVTSGNPDEIGAIRVIWPEALILATGIRDQKIEGDDQEHTGTIEEAVGAGADMLIIGQEIYSDPDPLRKVIGIKKRIVEALNPKREVRQFTSAPLFTPPGGW